VRTHAPMARMTAAVTAGAAGPGNEARAIRGLCIVSVHEGAWDLGADRDFQAWRRQGNRAAAGPGNETGINGLDSARARPRATASGLTQAATTPPCGGFRDDAESPRSDTEPAPRRGHDHEVPHRGPAS